MAGIGGYTLKLALCSFFCAHQKVAVVNAGIRRAPKIILQNCFHNNAKTGQF